MCPEKQTSVQNVEELEIKAFELEMHYLKLRRELICLENSCLRQKLRMNARERKALKQQQTELQTKIDTWRQPKFDWQFVGSD